MIRRLLKPVRDIHWRAFAMILALGGVGGFIAEIIGLPIPFLIGSLVVIASLSIWLVATGRKVPPYPNRLRMFFVSFIGVMIGATFSPDLVGVLPELWPSLIGVMLYVFASSAAGYFVLRHIGRYDEVTAFYGSLPGGLIEATLLGEQAGGDVRILGVQQFVRIILVVVSVPLLFLFWEGHSVGSSAGQALSSDPAVAFDVLLIVVIGVVAGTIAPYLKIPAAHMMGPLLVSVLLHSTGMVDIHSPTWLLNLAQVVVGCGLGAMFGGTTLRQLLNTVWLGGLAVGAMLALALAFSVALAPISPVSPEALFISFAPGGVSEMGLIALSLGVSPVIVATHHLCRIIITVIFAGYMARRGHLRPAPSQHTSGPPRD